ncbi:MAG: single-stranded-DNA-specific exonuclease RecJ [Planctomycetota bacterium]
MPKKWIIPPPATQCETFARQWRVPPVVAQLLINRGLSPDQPCDGFLSPQLRDLYPPELLPGVTEAARRITDAVREKRRIVLYGDYDVDGTTGVAILWHVLRLAGGDVSFYVPHRVEEGYGLNLDAVNRLADEGAGLIVSVDCGITAVEAAEALAVRGVELIVTDHHTPQERIPPAAVIVHPTVGGDYPNPHLSGSGVAFKLAWAIAQRVCGSERVAPEYRDLLQELLPLAALGTIADVVPLIGENRIIARHGLNALPTTRLAGVRALIESAGLGGEKISCYDVGFKLAPRINAAGRMGHARLAVELFTRADAARAREIAIYLEEHNRSRQSTERKIVKQACEMIERDNLAGDARRAIVLAAEGWHAGVIGIVAARVVGRYHRPTVMIALGSGEGQGSARSIQHFDLAAALAECGGHLLAHGGHAAAAGLRIATDRVAAFTEAFIDIANNRLTGDDLTPKVRLDAEVSLDAMTLPTAEAIIGLGPFGVGNPRPLLATDWVELAAEPRCVGSGSDHLQATFRQGGVQLKGIGFGLAGELEDLKQHRRCRVAFEPIINDFNGRRSVEMQIVDMHFPP